MLRGFKEWQNYQTRISRKFHNWIQNLKLRKKDWQMIFIESDPKKIEKCKFRWIRHNYRYNNCIIYLLMSDYILEEICKLIFICFVKFFIPNFGIFLWWLLIKISFIFLNLTNKLGSICCCLIFNVDSLILSKMAKIFGDCAVLEQNLDQFLSFILVFCLNNFTFEKTQNFEKFIFWKKKFQNQ